VITNEVFGNGILFSLVLFAKATRHLIQPQYTTESSDGRLISRRSYTFVDVIISFRWHLIRKEDEKKNVEIPTAWLKLVEEILERNGRGWGVGSIDKTTQFDKTRFWVLVGGQNKDMRRGKNLRVIIRNFKVHFTTKLLNCVPEYTYTVSENISEYKVNFRKLHAFSYEIM
jgi:hypothetical protein